MWVKSVFLAHGMIVDDDQTPDTAWCEPLNLNIMAAHRNVKLGKTWYHAIENISSAAHDTSYNHDWVIRWVV